jgi:hypothetical protein
LANGRDLIREMNLLREHERSRRFVTVSRCNFRRYGCSSARINGMQPPTPMSRDAERQHIQNEGIEFCKPILTITKRRSNYCLRVLIDVQIEVRFRVVSRPQMLKASLSAFDPNRTCAALNRGLQFSIA